MHLCRDCVYLKFWGTAPASFFTVVCVAPEQGLGGPDTFTVCKWVTILSWMATIRIFLDYGWQVDHNNHTHYNKPHNIVSECSNEPERHFWNRKYRRFSPALNKHLWNAIVRDRLFIHRRELGYARLSPRSFSSNVDQNITKTPSTALFELDRQSVCSNWPCQW